LILSRDGFNTTLPIGESGILRSTVLRGSQKVLNSGGIQGGTPEQGTFGVLIRTWM
jgi:hypothetical protein